MFKTLRKIIQNLFIPHEHNNYRAKTLHIDFLTFYLISALVLTFTFKTIYARSGDVLGFATDITIDKLYQLTNQERVKNNLPTLTFNEKLTAAAQKKAEDMFAKNYWAHYSPDGKTPWDFILSSGYQYEYAGENLAKNFLFSQGVIDAWLNSPSHRENLLRSDYKEVGFAVVNGVLNGEQTTLVVQMFGRPLVSTIAKKPEAENQAIPVESPKGNQLILAQQSRTNSNTLSGISVNTSLIFMLFLVIAVSLDFYFANKLKIIRIGSKNLAHLIFIGFLIMGLFIFTKGAIL